MSRRALRDAGPPTPKPKPGPPRTTEIEVVRVAPPAPEPVDPRDQKPRRPRRRRRRRAAPRVQDRVLVFVGPMAAGKTSLGKRVARELGVPFVDSDAVFVRQYGQIVEFFAEHGEQEFRKREAEVIAAELASGGGKVLALGGGAVLTESTRALLKLHPVVLLMTTQEAVLRTANLSRRPLLRDDPNAWGRILKERKPLYDEVSDITFRTDRATKEQLTRRVSHWARTFRGKPGC